MKKTPRKRIIEELDKAWSLLIRAKYPECIICGNSPTQAHHAIARKAQGYGVRWLLNNGIGLCKKCHIFKLHGSQGDVEFLLHYLEVLNEAIPPEEQKNIIDIKHQITKYSIQDLEDLLMELRGRIKEDKTQ